MKGTIQLKIPVKIDGEAVDKLSYDTDKITMEMYCLAANRAIVKGGGPTGINAAIDAGMQLYLGAYAVVAQNPSYDVTDVERVKGPDIIQLMRVGLNFISGRDESEPEGFDGSSEGTRGSTTQTLSA